MKDTIPEEHHFFISALPEMRAHFEEAAKRSPDHSFVLRSLAEEFAQAEMLIAAQPGHRIHVERARSTLLIAAGGSDYYPLVAHEFDEALAIWQRHHKGPKL
jgi:hypothetical protein